MKRRIIQQALIACTVSLTFLLAGCTTTETRIQERPEAFRALSPNDQALVQQGKIREGMSQDAVYIAWGPPSSRIPGRVRGRIVETWIYDATAAGERRGGSSDPVVLVPHCSARASHERPVVTSWCSREVFLQDAAPG